MSTSARPSMYVNAAGTPFFLRLQARGEDAERIYPLGFECLSDGIDKSSIAAHAVCTVEEDGDGRTQRIGLPLPVFNRGNVHVRQINAVLRHRGGRRHSHSRSA